MLNVAHRGASGLAPEHTFPSYDLALASGADYLELDVHMTRDGVLVVLHDATLDRTTDGHGFVRDATLADLKELDAGEWFDGGASSAGHAGLRIPTLAEVFGRYGGRARFCVEMKDPEMYPGMEEALLEVLPAALRPRVLVESFSAPSLRTVRRLDPELSLLRLYPPVGPAAVAASLDETASYAGGVGLCREDVVPEVVEAAHELSLAVHVYTVEDPVEMEALATAGVDGIVTNFPGRLALVQTASADEVAL